MAILYGDMSSCSARILCSPPSCWLSLLTRSRCLVETSFWLDYGPARGSLLRRLWKHVGQSCPQVGKDDGGNSRNSQECLLERAHDHIVDTPVSSDVEDFLASWMHGSFPWDTPRSVRSQVLLTTLQVVPTLILHFISILWFRSRPSVSEVQSSMFFTSVSVTDLVCETGFKWEFEPMTYTVHLFVVSTSAMIIDCNDDPKTRWMFGIIPGPRRRTSMLCLCRQNFLGWRTVTQWTAKWDGSSHQWRRKHRWIFKQLLTLRC